MATDLRSQTRDLFVEVDSVQGPIDVAEIAALAATVDSIVRANVEEPVALTAAVGRRKAWRNLVAAVAAALVVLLLIGGTAWLSRGVDVPPADSPTPTTEAIDQTTFDVDSIPLPVIAEAVTPSSIGAVTWTVYEGSWTDELEAGLDSAARSSTPASQRPPTPTLPESIVLHADGIVVDATPNFIGGTTELALHDWAFAVDWVETAALRGGEEIREAAAGVDGRVGAVVNRQTGEIDILLFASANEKHNYIDSSRRGSDGLPTDTTTPFELVAQYRFVTVESEGQWTLDAFDRVTGERIGSITSGLPLVNDGFPEGIVTVSTPDSVTLTEPEWLEEAARNGYNWIGLDLDDSLFLYVEGDGTTYVAWRSTNGEDWENLGRVFPPGYMLQQIEGNADTGWTAYLDNVSEPDAPAPNFIHAFSNDGLNWTIYDDLPEHCGNIYRLAAGWVCTSDPLDQFTLDVWTSPDGLTWDEIITTGLPSLAELSGTSFSSTSRQAGDDTIILHVTTDAQPETRIWLIQFP